MKCKICQGALRRLTFRAFAPHFHFPAHGDDDWDVCLGELMSQNFAPIYREFSEIVELSYRGAKSEIVDALTNPEKAFDLLLNQVELEAFIKTNFPERGLSDYRNLNWSLTEVNLDAETYRRLIAYELKCGSTVRPRRLRETTKEILHRLETGQMPFVHPLYYERLNFSRRSQLIDVPYELKQAVLSGGWLSRDRPFERLLLLFAETVKTSQRYEKMAYSVIRNEFRPTQMVEQETKVIKIIDMPGMVEDKKHSIKLALQSINPEAIQHLLGKVPDMGNSKRLSLRVDSEDKAMINYLARQFNVPEYKLATALLMWVGLTRR